MGKVIKMSNWTQPICEDCYFDKKLDTPFKVKDAPSEICCNCGDPTVDGIYIRINPNEVEYPTRSE